MEKQLKKKALNSFIWKFLERSGSQIIQFIIQLILARLLLPKDYGIIALTTVFISLSMVFIQSGFSKALIQRDDINEIDYSSVFYISIFVAIICYIILFLISPIIANFYRIYELKKIIRVLGIILFLGSFNSIQQVIVEKKLEFKKIFYSSLISVGISGIIGIFLAFHGFGVWALVIQQIINQLIVLIILFLNIRWYPRLIFSLKRVENLFSFGWKLLVSAMIETLYRELTNLIVGKRYSAQVLGVYNRGNQFPNMIVNNFNGAIQSVLFPVLASLQKDEKLLKKVMRKGIVISSYIIFPCMVGLAVVAESLVKFLLTDTWLTCVPYLRIFCFSYALWPIHTTNLQAINAIGRSDIFLKLEIFKKMIGISMILITYRYTPYVMAIGVSLSSIVNSFINAYPNKKLFNYGYVEQLKDIYPSFLMSLCMAMPIYFIKYLNLSNINTLLLQIIIGSIIYFLLSYLFKVEGFIYIMEIIKKQKEVD